MTLLPWAAFDCDDDDGCCSAAAAIFFLNHNITRQIIRLTKAASNVEKGKLDVQVDINRDDEIGQLFKSFNTMASRIQNLVADLEEKKKTAEIHLQRAIESISEGFALHDASDRLVLSNHKYREFHSGVQHLAVPGVKFEELTRVAAEQGLYSEATANTVDWIQQRVEKHLNPQGQ